MGIVAALVVIGGVSSLTDVGEDASTPSTATSVAPKPSAAVHTREPPTRGKTSTPRATTTRGAALAALGGLAVKGRAPKTGYSREQFGQSWRDLDRNGCDQRNDVLRRDLRKITLKAGTHGCLVLSGTVTSWYTGEVIHFVRGQDTSQLVQIDHLVALSDAWQKGAQKLSATRREALANDFLELRAVDGHSNGSKSDSDAASWLPPRHASRCGYVARQIAVKRKYGLWVTSAERDAMARILNTCPRQGLPRAHAIKLGGGPEKSGQPPATRAPKPHGGGSTYYENCDAVRAAGRDPIRKGDPGYSRSLDRDGDGVGCES